MERTWPLWRCTSTAFILIVPVARPVFCQRVPRSATLRYDLSAWALCRLLRSFAPWVIFQYQPIDPARGAACGAARDSLFAPHSLNLGCRFWPGSGPSCLRRDQDHPRSAGSRAPECDWPPSRPRGRAPFTICFSPTCVTAVIRAWPDVEHRGGWALRDRTAPFSFIDPIWLLVPSIPAVNAGPGVIVGAA